MRGPVRTGDKVSTMRPTDLAREHGLSTQAVRNYERAGFLPPAERTPTGYRVYTEVHAAALRAYLALIPAHGHAAAGQIMTALHDDDLDGALTVVDRGHAQLLRDRSTLDAVRDAAGHLTGRSPAPFDRTAAGIGDVARRLRVTPATLRTWERAGILTPGRDRATGYRSYRADDVRDAELAHLLRRGGYPLAHIAEVVTRIRTAGGTGTLAAALEQWRHRLTVRGLALLRSATRLAEYLTVRGPQ